MERFRDYGMLQFSLRSFFKYAPWVNNFYIVTNGQVPVWLDTTHPRVHVVTHAEIFKHKGDLPTFNSNAIELNLHRIAGLSECFFYLNDDFFVSQPVTKDFYVDQEHERLNIYFESRTAPSQRNMRKKDWYKSVAFTNMLLSQYYYPNKVTKRHHFVSHTCYFFDKNILRLLEERYNSSFAQTQSARFRTINDVVLQFLHANTALEEFGANMFSAFGGYHQWTSNHFKNEAEWRQFMESKFPCACFNDNFSGYVTDKSEIENLSRKLCTLFPFPSPVEKQGFNKCEKYAPLQLEPMPETAKVPEYQLSFDRAYEREGGTENVQIPIVKCGNTIDLVYFFNDTSSEMDALQLQLFLRSVDENVRDVRYVIILTRTTIPSCIDVSNPQYLRVVYLSQLLPKHLLDTKSEKVIIAGLKNLPSWVNNCYLFVGNGFIFDKKVSTDDLLANELLRLHVLPADSSLIKPTGRTKELLNIKNTQHLAYPYAFNKSVLAQIYFTWKETLDRLFDPSKAPPPKDSGDDDMLDVCLVYANLMSNFGGVVSRVSTPTIVSTRKDAAKWCTVFPGESSFELDGCNACTYKLF